MSYKWICFAAVLGFAVAVPVKFHLNADEVLKAFNNEELGRNNALETLIIDALEDLRQLMVTGSDDIPVLDPLHIEHVFVDDAVIPIPGAHVELNNVVISKFSTFKLNEVKVTTISTILRRYSVQIEFDIPVLDVEAGGYDLLINFWGLDLFGKGDAKIKIVKPAIRIDTNLNIRISLAGLFLNITDLQIEIGLSDIEFAITGMFNDPLVDSFINTFLRNLILELFKYWADEISDIISPIVKDVANDILSDINLIDFLP